MHQPETVTLTREEIEHGIVPALAILRSIQHGTQGHICHHAIRIIPAVDGLVDLLVRAKTDFTAPEAP